jgi:hypothetical protein
MVLEVCFVVDVGGVVVSVVDLSGVVVSVVDVGGGVANVIGRSPSVEKATN